MFKDLGSFLGLDAEDNLRRLLLCETSFFSKIKRRGLTLPHELGQFCQTVRSSEDKDTISATISRLLEMMARDQDPLTMTVILFYLAVAHSKIGDFDEASTCCKEFEKLEFGNSDIKELKDIIDKMRPLTEKSWFAPVVGGVALAGGALIAAKAISNQRKINEATKLREQEQGERSALVTEDWDSSQSMDSYRKTALDNRANQQNPNHVVSGPGRPGGYRGAGTKDDLDNHGNQLNPNNPRFQARKSPDEECSIQ